MRSVQLKRQECLWIWSLSVVVALTMNSRVPAAAQESAEKVATKEEAVNVDQGGAIPPSKLTADPKPSKVETRTQAIQRLQQMLKEAEASVAMKTWAKESAIAELLRLEGEVAEAPAPLDGPVRQVRVQAKVTVTDADGKKNVISRPQVITSDGQTASILIADAAGKGFQLELTPEILSVGDKPAGDQTKQQPLPERI